MASAGIELAASRTVGAVFKVNVEKADIVKYNKQAADHALEPRLDDGHAYYLASASSLSDCNHSW